MTSGDRVQLVPSMRRRFWDINTRHGTVKLMDSDTPVIAWDGLPEVVRCHQCDLEPAGTPPASDNLSAVSDERPGAQP